MRHFLPVFLAFTLLVSLQSVQAQFVDSICDPTAGIVNMPKPSSCGSGNRITMPPLPGSTQTATAQIPTPLCQCSPVKATGWGVKDVWYKVSVSTDQLEVKIDPFGAAKRLDTAQIALFEIEDGCRTLIPKGCAKGVLSGTARRVFAVDPGHTYAIQIASHRHDTGQFRMTLSVWDSCAVRCADHSVSVDPPPVNGVYPPGTEVSFCYLMEQWDSSGGNFPHGFYPEFGPGWDTSILELTFHTLSVDGNGLWMEDKIPITGPPGTFDKRGLFYDRAPFLDLDPFNNGGDHMGQGSFFAICFKVTTRANDNCVDKQDLSVKITTLNDAETGNNPINSCRGERPWEMRPILRCCDGFGVGFGEVESCVDTCDGYVGIDFFSVSAPCGNRTWNWYAPTDTLIRSFKGNGVMRDSVTGLCSNGGNYVLIHKNQCNGCYYQRAFKMVTDTGLFSVFQADTACSGTCGMLAGFNGNDSIYTSWAWYDCLDTTGTVLSTNKKTGLCEGVYKLVATTANGCSHEQKLVMQGVPFIPASFFYVTPPAFNAFCANDSAQLPIGFLGTWTSNPPGFITDPLWGEFTPQPVPNPTLVQVHHITGLSTQCFDTATVGVLVLPIPNAPTVITNPLVGCVGDTVVAKVAPGGPGITNWWSSVPFADSTYGPLDTATLWALNPTQAFQTSYYAFHAITDPSTGKRCFSNPSEFTISFEEGDADAGPDITICPGHTATLNGTSSGTLDWHPGYLLNSDSTIANPTVNLDSTMAFVLEGLSANGCYGRDSVWVIIENNDSCLTYTLFSGFTPNGDGDNDVWIIEGIEAFPENTVHIFNRWGTEQWYAEGYNNTTAVWDGKTWDGVDLPSGTYFYLVTTSGGTRKGWVELTR